MPTTKEAIQGIVKRKKEFLDRRFRLAEHNRNSNLFRLLQGEIVELLAAIENVNQTETSDKMIEVVEEFPDILLYCLQHWILTNEPLYNARISLHQSRQNSRYLEETPQMVIQNEMFDIACELEGCLSEKKQTECILRLLELTFALTEKFGYDLIHLTIIKETYNELRFCEDDFSPDSGLTYDEAYQNTKTRERQKDMKKNILYPWLSGSQGVHGVRM